MTELYDRFVSMCQTLAHEPSTWLCLTLLAYALGMWIYQRSKFLTICSPMIVASVVLIAILLVSGTDYGTYLKGAGHIHFLLGPATVALAVPLFEQRRRLAQLWLPLLCGLVAGAVVALVSAVGIAAWIGAPKEILISLAPKSVTVPIAMGVSEQLGGVAELTATIVAITGVVGALIARPLFALLGEKDDAVRGFSIGLAAHGMGTATAFQINRDTGAFAGLAMGLTGLLTAFLAPVILPWLLAWWL